MTLEPDCRYGHGKLVAVHVDPDNYWGLFGVYVKRAVAGEITAGQGLAELVPSQKVFTLTAFRCPKCGYMEIFDEGFRGE